MGIGDKNFKEQNFKYLFDRSTQKKNIAVWLFRGKKNTLYRKGGSIIFILILYVFECSRVARYPFFVYWNNRNSLLPWSFKSLECLIHFAPSQDLKANPCGCQQESMGASDLFHHLTPQLWQVKSIPGTALFAIDSCHSCFVELYTLSWL